MAGSFIPFEGGLENLIADLHKQVEAVSTTPSAGNQSIINGGQSVLNQALAIETIHGQYVWPTAPWVGTTIYGLITFDNVGHPVVVCGLQPDGLYGLGVYDAAGSRTVLLGQQPTTGVVGLAVKNSAGVLQQVAGSLASSGSSVFGYGSATPSATSANITGVPIGSSHLAQVTWNATLLNGTGGPGYVELYLDGAQITTPNRPTISVSPGTQGSVSRSLILDCGSAGNHSFRLYVWTLGTTFDFINPTLIVQPL